jgi:hypothetical protein
MRQITRKAVEALLVGSRYKNSNTEVRDNAMYLHGNKIAWLDVNGQLWISHCGYRTNTTKERLNGLPLVSIKQKDFCWYLNGAYWDGTPIKVGSLSCLF